MIYQINKNKFAAMGVINITPNSFNDGNENFSLSRVKEKIETIINFVEIIDIGAESTAPMNQAISWREELKRLEDYFFPCLDDFAFSKKIISIDTYHEETFSKVYEFLKSKNSNQRIIWNDISGKDSVILNELFKDKNFSYVFCHNLSPARNRSTEHMNFISSKMNDDFFNEIYDFFSLFLSKYNMKKQIFIDPCFGFSKTREQNHYLLKKIAHFLKKFSDEYSIIIAISRKSFLRNIEYTNIKDPIVQRHTDIAQAIVFQEILRKVQNKTIYARLHNPIDAQSIDFTLKNLCLLD